MKPFKPMPIFHRLVRVVFVHLLKIRVKQFELLSFQNGTFASICIKDTYIQYILIIPTSVIGWIWLLPLDETYDTQLWVHSVQISGINKSDTDKSKSAQPKLIKGFALFKLVVLCGVQRKQFATSSGSWRKWTHGATLICVRADQFSTNIRLKYQCVNYYLCKYLWFDYNRQQTLAGAQR